MDDNKTEEQREHKEAFAIFDSDKDGKLNYEEATYAFFALGFNFSEEEVTGVMAQYGVN